MAQLDNIRRILKEDYPKKYHDIIDKLAFTLNRFMDQVVGTVNGNIDFDNLNQGVTQFSMTVDSSGTPVGNNLFKIEQTNVAGFIVISAINKTNGAVFPTSTPFISATRSNFVIKVNNISGLQADNKYDLTVMIIGN